MHTDKCRTPLLTLVIAFDIKLWQKEDLGKSTNTNESIILKTVLHQGKVPVISRNIHERFQWYVI